MSSQYVTVYLSILIVILAIVLFIVRRVNRRTLEAHLDAIKIVLGHKILEKYEPGNYLYPREIEQIRDALYTACDVRELNKNNFDHLIKSLESENSLNLEHAETLKEVFDLNNMAGEKS